MAYATVAQLGEQLARARQRTALRQDLAEELAVASLDRASLVVAERAPQLARERAREQAAAHADAPVDAPAVDGHVALGERSLPGEDVGVDGVDERAVEVEDERGHARTLGHFALSAPMKTAMSAWSAAARACVVIGWTRSLSSSRHAATA